MSFRIGFIIIIWRGRIISEIVPNKGKTAKKNPATVLNLQRPDLQNLFYLIPIHRSQVL